MQISLPRHCLLISLLVAATTLPDMGSGQQTRCASKISSCQCRTESGKYIDLQPLAKQGDYRFKRVPGPPITTWVYSYNPCFGFKCQGADNVAVCQNNEKSTEEFALGTEDSAQFGYAQGPGLYVNYSDDHSGTSRVAMVSLVCDPQATGDTFEPLDNGVGALPVVYSSKLTSRHACEVDSLPVPGGVGSNLSGGDILLIVFFVTLLAYLAGGFAVNALVLKKGVGPGSLPNAEFWLALPGYIRDGAAFCLARVRRLFTQRGGGGGYEGI